ncbi:MAG: prepilin-type N-terminal cleavage/methylation domain-containing protein [bacterium]
MDLALTTLSTIPAPGASRNARPQTCSDSIYRIAGLAANRVTGSARKGFTLLEVMIGITLLVIIVLPLASLYAVSLTTIQESALYSEALQLAQERMELASLLDYDGLNYENEALAPGFQFFNRGSRRGEPNYQTAYTDQRDDPTTTTFVEESFDPTDTDGEGYPVPIYRDYYNNFTGDLIDPNFNGLCDDDLNGDGIVDATDEWIGNPNRDIWNTGGSFPTLDGQPRAGDGLYDTVVEGLYANSYDVLFGIRSALRNGSREDVSPLQDDLLKRDYRRYDGGGGGIPVPIADYEHKNRTFDVFCRMTSIIDPTPRCSDPNDSATLVDQRYVGERVQNDSYTQAQVAKIFSCLERDLPIQEGATNLTVAPHRTTADPAVLEAQWRQNTGFNKVATQPQQGKLVVVRVFYLSGESDNTDDNGDGFPDGETYATANQVVLQRMIADSDRHSAGNLIVTGPDGPLDSYPAPDMKISQSIYESFGVVVPDVTGDDYESDFCSLANDGLPYFDTGYFQAQ